MARDDYIDYGTRGQRRGSENMDEREWQQADWQRQQGRQGWYTQGGGGFAPGQGGFGQGGYGQGGYGQGWSGQSGFGQGGYTQGGGGYGAGGSGQQWSGGRSGWQGSEGPGMYGQGGYGQGGYGQGAYGQGAYGYRAQEFQTGQSQGGAYPSRDFGREAGRDRDTGTGAYGQGGGFSRQQGHEPQGYGQPGSWQPGYWQPGYGQSVQPGQHVGRGPKGYRRSDERIREDVNEELTRHPEIDATEIEVLCENGEVTLIGVVEERRDKRLAEDIVERVGGVTDVHNQLRAKKGIGQKISELLTGGSEREGDRDRDAAEVRSRSGRSTSS